MKIGTSPATFAARVVDMAIILCAAALLYAGWRTQSQAFRRGAPQLGSTPARRYRTRPGELT
jgi:TRAP-type C4-dicarboxylate transport system permease small subunit